MDNLTIEYCRKEYNMNDSLTIVIMINEINKALLYNCIHNLNNAISKKDNYHIVILDNNSGVKTPQDVYDEKEFPNLMITYESTFITRTYGYLLNNRTSIFDSKSDVLLLDPRVFCTKETIDKLREVAYSYPKYGFICASHSVNGAKSVIVPSNNDIIYIKRDIFNKNSIYNDCVFEESFESITAVIRDFAIKSLMFGYNVVEANIPYITANFKYIDNYDNDKQRMEELWGLHYFNTIGNRNIVNAINADINKPIKVLEVGCDLGATLLDIKYKFPNATICGTDINPYAIRVAKHLLDDAMVYDIDECALPYKSEYFDYIIFGDVLEHLRDPLKVVKYCKTLLKKDGRIISSIPNLMHYSILKDLLINGEFTYTDTGLLDRTHIHLFTEKEINKMFTEAGYNIDNVRYLETNPTKYERDFINQLLTIPGSDITAKMLSTFQFLYIVSKK